MIKEYYCNDNDPKSPFYAAKPAYNGEAVRIKPYWTQPIVNDPVAYFQSWNAINRASQTLREHTLSLDYGSLNAYNIILPFNDYLYTNRVRERAKNYEPYRNLIPDSPAEQNRLIVIFGHLGGIESGHCALVHNWLPFVIVDPTKWIGGPTLIHEIGHACRAGHVEGSVMEQASDKFRNFCNIHVQEIYNSYWCKGPRPLNWWNVTSGCFLWETEPRLRW